METVWDVHGIVHNGDVHDRRAGQDVHDHDGHAARHATTPTESRDEPTPEVTALLVSYRNGAGAIRIPSMINRQTDMQAAVPAIEITRLLPLLGVGTHLDARSICTRFPTSLSKSMRPFPCRWTESNPTVVTGTLELTGHDESGIFYRLRNARPG